VGIKRAAWSVLVPGGDGHIGDGRVRAFLHAIHARSLARAPSSVTYLIRVINLNMYLSPMRKALHVQSDFQEYSTESYQHSHILFP